MSTTRPSKPRGLGRTARQLANEAECELVSADRYARKIADGECRDPRDVTDSGARVRVGIARALYALARQLALGVDASEENGDAK